MTNEDWLAQIEAAARAGGGRVTSSYRSPEEQEALRRSGKTRVPGGASSHNRGTSARPGAIDLSANLSEADARRIASTGGREVAKMIYETGKGKNQGTGAHWHVEYSDAGGKSVAASQNGAGGAYNSSSPGKGVADPAAYLADLESSLGPEVAASTNVQQNATRIFGSDKELATRADAVEGQLMKQGQQLDVLDQAMQVAQSGAREAMTRQIDQTRDISNEIVKGTQELKEKIMPIFKARGRVADQLDKLATMNPLERGIRGIFDLNYDDDYLEGQLDKFDRTLKARSDDYNYLNQLHGVAMQEIERRYTLDTAMPGLIQKQAEEDLGLTGMRITQTAGMLGSLRDRISTESQLISAKAIAREDLMGRLDIPTVTDLMTKAQENGGVVQFNGVEFSYKELRDRIQQSEQQELQIETYKMAIASNRMDMATKYAENLARSLTRSQLEAAINNGGVYNGVQLPQDVLTNLYQGAIGRDETRAATVAREMPAKLAMDTATNHLNQVTGLYQRGRGLFGNQAMEGSAPFTERAGQLVRRLTQAIQNGEPPEVVTALTQQIAQNSEGYTKFIDDRILRQVGGDQRAAGYLKGFVYGSELSPGTAVEAMTYFAVKGNLPEGVSLSPEAKQVFQKAQTLVKNHSDDMVGGKKISQQQLMSIVQRGLTESASKIMGQARHDKLFNDMPIVASASKHPFGKFDRTRWAQIRSEASMTAAESIANAVSTTPQNVLTMLRTGKPITNDEDGKSLFKETQKRANQFNGVESQTMVRLLDMEPQIQTGRRNSTVLADFMGSPQFSQGINTYGRTLGSQSMGEYLVNPLTSGATERNFIETRQNILDAQSRIHQTDRQMAQNPATSMLLKPVARTAMILKSIPGVNDAGAKALAPVVQEFYSKYDPATRGDPMSFNDRFVSQDKAFGAFLQGSKFENPQMEIYRKVALKGWTEHSTRQQGFISQMVDAVKAGLSGDLPSINDAEF
jgi:hypothetical protein